jgi:hypothetical protein
MGGLRGWRHLGSRHQGSDDGDMCVGERVGEGVGRRGREKGREKGTGGGGRCRGRKARPSRVDGRGAVLSHGAGAGRGSVAVMVHGISRRTSGHHPLVICEPASLPTCQPAERLGADGRAAPEASACSPQTCQSGQRVPRLAENVVVLVVLDRPTAVLTGCVNIR